jgi:hypothetical protein
MAKREVYHSSPSKDGGWKVTKGGQTISNHNTQKASETAAIKAGHRAKNQGGFAQAVLHKADGRIREERTYGADPRSRKG